MGGSRRLPVDSINELGPGPSSAASWAESSDERSESTTFAAAGRSRTVLRSSTTLRSRTHTHYAFQNAYALSCACSGKSMVGWLAPEVLGTPRLADCDAES